MNHFCLGKIWPNSLNKQANVNNDINSNVRNGTNLNDPTSSSLNHSDMFNIKNDKNETLLDENKNDKLGEPDNQKENGKTPMCIINELVKFNKVNL